MSPLFFKARVGSLIHTWWDLHVVHFLKFTSVRETLDREQPLDRDPCWTDTPAGQIPLLDRYPCWTDTPAGQIPLLDRDPPGRNMAPGDRTPLPEGA